MIDLKHVVLKLTLFVYLYISVFVYLHLCACDSNAFYFTNIEPTLYVRVGKMAVSKHLFVNASLFLVTQTFKQYLLVAKTQTPTLIQSTIVKHKSVLISWSMKLSSKTAGNSNS